MKALEYLKSERKEFIGYEDQFHNEVTALDEAIAELEALQQRSCEGCKYNRTDEDFHSYMCDDCSRKSIDRYEPKEQ